MREVILACETRAIVSPTCLLGKLNLEARFISPDFTVIIQVRNIIIITISLALVIYDSHWKILFSIAYT